MCGFTGFWELQSNRFTQGHEAQVAEKMADTLRMRGPDDGGSWSNTSLGIAFGYRRLSILDLSPQGAQPMRSQSGKSTLVFNGEIYNFKELKKELTTAGIPFKGHSDTEVLLEACELYGVENAARKCIGMFAFALWREDEKTLYLCRDRLGVKPLYWGKHNGVLFFGSQLHSFYPHPAFKPTIDKEALALYFKYNYVPAPYSIFQDFQKLRPGHILSIPKDGALKESIYWSLTSSAQKARKTPYPYSFEEASDRLEVLLKDAVGKRMISDVPLGCFLSGGVDSSIVAALMQAQSSTPVKTFSIGFHDAIYDEAPYAKTIAQHLGTRHTELYCTAKDCLDLVQCIPSWFDEPFADASQIPTYLVSKLAREQVTVALSGDGGDEVFAGYNRYTMWSRYASILNMPYMLRLGAAQGLSAIPKSMLKHMERLKILPVTQIQEKRQKIVKVLRQKNVRLFYDELVSFWDAPQKFIKGMIKYPTMHQLPLQDDPILYMQMRDLDSYLPDDILTKVDRTSMAVSLEAREPLLDHRVVEYALQMPTHFKIDRNQTKKPLHHILNKYVPQELINRPKQGFSIPVDEWLKTTLKPWAEDLLSKDLLKKQDILDANAVHQQWEDFKAGKLENPHGIWGLLMFQSWYS